MARNARVSTLRYVAVATLALLLVRCGGPTSQSSRHGASKALFGVGSVAESGPSLTARQYFEADARSDYSEMARLSTGRLGALWRWFHAELGACTCPPKRIDIEKLDLMRVHNGRAVLDLSGRSDSGTQYSGPLVLVRKGTAWRVVDYRRDGLDVMSTITPTRARPQTLDGLTIQVLGLYTPALGGELWVRVTDRNNPMVVKALRAVDRWGAVDSPDGISPNIVNVVPGPSLVTDFRWAFPHPLQPGQAVDVQPVFQDVITGHVLRFHLRVQVPGPSS
jgi:hypothetical protein